MKLLTLILLLISLNCTAQYGRYKIEKLGNERIEGFVLITPYSIVLDSVKLPVKDIVREKGKTFFFLKGCYQDVTFLGCATLYHLPDTQKNRQNCVLYLEIRTQEYYISQRYQIYYVKLK